MNQSLYQKYSNITSVESLQDAVNRVFVPNSEYVFYCDPDKCFYVISLDALGNRQYLKYVREQPKDVDNLILDRIKKLEDYVYGSKTSDRINEPIKTSSIDRSDGDDTAAKC